MDDILAFLSEFLDFTPSFRSRRGRIVVIVAALIVAGIAVFTVYNMYAY